MGALRGSRQLLGSDPSGLPGVLCITCRTGREEPGRPSNEGQHFKTAPASAPLPPSGRLIPEIWLRVKYWQFVASYSCWRDSYRRPSATQAPAPGPRRVLLGGSPGFLGESVSRTAAHGTTATSTGARTMGPRIAARLLPVAAKQDVSTGVNAAIFPFRRTAAGWPCGGSGTDAVLGGQ